MSKVGYIYILTNKSFRDNCIKIGYSVDVERRVKDLSGSGLPYDYEIYCTYEIPASQKADKSLHRLIQMLNPNLRITPNREFFDISPELAYKMFEEMAAMHGREDKLKLYKDDAIDIGESHKKGEPFSFTKCQIPVGSEIVYIHDESITARVVDDRKIEYQGEIMYMTTLAKRLINKNTGVNGPAFFKYKGVPLPEYYNKYQA
jgi:hypothetical protein